MASSRRSPDQRQRHGRTRHHQVSKKRRGLVPAPVQTVVHDTGQEVRFDDDTVVFHAIESPLDAKQRRKRTHKEVRSFRKRFAFAGLSPATAGSTA